MYHYAALASAASEEEQGSAMPPSFFPLRSTLTLTGAGERYATLLLPAPFYADINRTCPHWKRVLMLHNIFAFSMTVVCPVFAFSLPVSFNMSSAMSNVCSLTWNESSPDAFKALMLRTPAAIESPGFEDSLTSSALGAVIGVMVVIWAVSLISCWMLQRASPGRNDLQSSAKSQRPLHFALQMDGASDFHRREGGESELDWLDGMGPIPEEEIFFDEQLNFARSTSPENILIQHSPRHRQMLETFPIQNGASEFSSGAEISDSFQNQRAAPDQRADSVLLLHNFQPRFQNSTDTRNSSLSPQHGHLPSALDKSSDNQHDFFKFSESPTTPPIRPFWSSRLPRDGSNQFLVTESPTPLSYPRHVFSRSSSDRQPKAMSVKQSFFDINSQNQETVEEETFTQLKGSEHVDPKFCEKRKAFDRGEGLVMLLKDLIYDLLSVKFPQSRNRSHPPTSAAISDIVGIGSTV
ncbi:unnamed protein product, partial [Cyprideis torosa]